MTYTRAVSDRSETTVIPTLQKGQPFGPYELLGELGTGASGVVFHAWHAGLQRHCALKLLHARIVSDEAKARFEKEGRSTAKLGKHPNIVQVFDAGHVDNVPYLAMELVKGAPLDRLLRERGQLSQEETLELGRKIALALDHAHRRGIIHRDMKPGNVIVDEDGEPQVLDFGLAKDLDNTSELSQAGLIIGTPAYLPPEQAEPVFGVVDHRADIYSLGATLYTALTADLPFRAPSVVDTIVQVLTAPPPRLTDRGVSPDVQAIIMRAMEKRPDDRYQTALEFTDDLSRALKGELPKARPLTPLDRFWRLMKRRPWATSAALISTFVVFLLAGWFSYQRSEADTLWKRLSSQIASATADETRNLLEPALPMLEEMSELARFGLLPVDDMDALGKHLAVRFRPRKTLDWISYGRADGEFVGVKRGSDGVVVLNRSSATERRVQEKRVADDLSLTTIRDAKDSYDPRKRPFYGIASAATGPVWTRAYKYWGDDGLGITATLAVRGPGQQMLGALTVDFRLQTVSEFLAGLQLGEGGQAFVLRSQATKDPALSPRVLAGPDPAHTLKTPPLVDAALEAFGQDLATLSVGVPASVRFSAGEVNCLGALEAFEIAGGVRWVTFVAVPTSTLGLSTAPLFWTFGLAGFVLLAALGALWWARVRERRLTRARAQVRRNAFVAASAHLPAVGAPKLPEAASPSEETVNFQR